MSHPLSGMPYRPRNGTEGEMFEMKWCHNCIHYDASVLEGDQCGDGIISRTMFFDPDELEYPEEWNYDVDGHPQCTAYLGKSPPELVNYWLKPKSYNSEITIGDSTRSY